VVPHKADDNSTTETSAETQEKLRDDTVKRQTQDNKEKNEVGKCTCDPELTMADSGPYCKPKPGLVGGPCAGGVGCKDKNAECSAEGICVCAGNSEVTRLFTCYLSETLREFTFNNLILVIVLASVAGLVVLLCCGYHIRNHMRWKKEKQRLARMVMLTPHQFDTLQAAASRPPQVVQMVQNPRPSRMMLGPSASHHSVHSVPIHRRPSVVLQRRPSAAIVQTTRGPMLVEAPSFGSLSSHSSMSSLSSYGTGYLVESEIF
jgi:hypothetical protein